jgi:hypothetical protein
MPDDSQTGFIRCLISVQAATNVGAIKKIGKQSAAVNLK